MPGVVTAFPDPDIHANRPAASSGAVFYSCTTHSKVYRSDGSTWIDWLLLSGFSGDAVDVTFDPTGLANTSATDVQNAIADLDGAIAGAGGSSLLAVTAYAASGDNTITNANTSDADFDATNLQITFTAPASGNVLVKLSGVSNPGGGNVHWTVRESTSTLGDAYQSSTLAAVIRYQVAIYITGVSAGSHTYKWGGYTTSGTITLYHGTTASKFGKLVMEVWGAP